MALPAHGQTQAPLAALVERLQANPGDDALRRQVIERARDMRPAPTISEEARRAFVQGTSIARAAADAASQRLAVQSFETAVNLAPWWGDAYYNRAVAQDLAGDLASARASLQFYLLTNPPEHDAREAQDRIYSLEGRERLAAAQREEERRQGNQLVGRWQVRSADNARLTQCQIRPELVQTMELSAGGVVRSHWQVMIVGGLRVDVSGSWSYDESQLLMRFPETTWRSSSVTPSNIQGQLERTDGSSAYFVMCRMD
jgi:tetratricopeptide (TPR) repeat protein